MRKIIATAAALAIMLISTPAQALPTASFTYTPPTTFTSTGICDAPPCRYQWRYYRTTSPDRLGTTMGEGQTLTYQLPTGTWKVVLKVTNSQVRGGVTSTQYIVIG